MPIWTQKQVDSLNDFQAAGWFHPFTCGNCGAYLKATVNGWVCSCSGDTIVQTWANSFMVDGSWRNCEPGLKRPAKEERT